LPLLVVLPNARALLLRERAELLHLLAQLLLLVGRELLELLPPLVDPLALLGRELLPALGAFEGRRRLGIVGARRERRHGEPKRRGQERCSRVPSPTLHRPSPGADRPPRSCRRRGPAGARRLSYS